MRRAKERDGRGMIGEEDGITTGMAIALLAVLNQYPAEWPGKPAGRTTVGGSPLTRPFREKRLQRREAQAIVRSPATRGPFACY